MDSKINNDNSIQITLSDNELRILNGVLSIVDALPNPDWSASTGEDDTAITENEFDSFQAQWFEHVLQKVIDAS